jgi:tripartite-type tricarboxylate transporter receptor subunit TctC
MIVPYPAGGGADAVARVIAERMRTFLGGAGGSIGTGRGRPRNPDGYTLGIGNWSTHVANGVMYALPYQARASP